MIYHITTSTQWQNAVPIGHFEEPSLQIEGFIHCSTKEQVKGVLERYYVGQKNLVLLHINEEKVIASIKFELAPSVNELFPHIFGSLNTDAVINVQPIDDDRSIELQF